MLIIEGSEGHYRHNSGYGRDLHHAALKQFSFKIMFRIEVDNRISDVGGELATDV